MGNQNHGDSKSWGFKIMGIQNLGDSKSWGFKIMGIQNRWDSKLWGFKIWGINGSVPSLPANGYKPLKPFINNLVYIFTHLCSVTVKRWHFQVFLRIKSGALQLRLIMTYPVKNSKNCHISLTF